MTENPGRVFLVGAGPGDPGLFTLKGKALLESADVVVYDALVSEPILAMIRPEALRIDAGKRRGRHTLDQSETNQLLIDQARAGAVVVRLKGGDPFVFGRGGEEMAELTAAGVEVEVVPGVTAGVAAPAYVGIPITHRDYASSVTFVTGHEAAGKYRPQVDWASLAAGAETLVIYMGLHNLAHIVEALRAGGRRDDTPISLIRWGTCPEQEVRRSTLGAVIADLREQPLEAPAIAVVGAVAGLDLRQLPTWPIPG